LKFYNHIFRLVKNGGRNSLFESSSAQVYIRLSKRLIGDGLTPTLDIARVEVAEEHRGAGVFKTLLSEAEQYCLNDPVVKTLYIENVMEPRLGDFFRRRNYVERRVGPDLCFYQSFYPPPAKEIL
jgi:GNAT superfamily N-acetyltransferase